MIIQIKFHSFFPNAAPPPMPSTKLLSLSSSFLPTPTRHLHRPRALKPSKSLNVSALILPPSSTPPSRGQKQLQQELYQPYRPPPSPLPPKFRNLDFNARLEILSNRMGLWFEYAPLISSLLQDGFISTTIEELTGIPSIEQNCLVVAAQVRDSLVQSTDEQTVAYFDTPSAPELLYAIRILNTPQRALAARFIIDNGFDGRRAEELSRSMKDYPRRYGERGVEHFDGNLPGDCLAFMYFRQALEHRSASGPELSKVMLEKALEVAETERAKQRIMQDLEGKGEGDDGAIEDVVRVPVVRMGFGEVAASSRVVVFPVCKAAEAEIEEAPWECGMEGEFGVVQAEKGWSRWVVLPGWGPLAGLDRGGVVIAFPKARGVLPWRAKRMDAEEEILVVVDRGVKEVESDSGYYLVASGGGNGKPEEVGLKVEIGEKLRNAGIDKCLGNVVLVVRPPREENDQIRDEEWD